VEGGRVGILLSVGVGEGGGGSVGARVLVGIGVGSGGGIVGGGPG
jgi:hypothetical protein